MKNTKTYMDKLMKDPKFRERFKDEYQNLYIGEQIAQARLRAKLTQVALAKRIHTTKSAVSRYESAAYRGYGIGLLSRVAEACGARLRVSFIPKG